MAGERNTFVGAQVHSCMWSSDESGSSDITMATSSNPVTSALTSTLSSYLKGLGFTKVTNRKFARERNEVIQQLWVDANGVAGARRARIVLCANFPFGPVSGYMDPHGFQLGSSRGPHGVRMGSGRSWNMSSVDSAQRAMEQIVTSLQAGEIKFLEELSDLDTMVAALRPYTRQNWFDTFSRQLEMWRSGDPTLRSAADENRRKLKLE